MSLKYRGAENVLTHDHVVLVVNVAVEIKKQDSIVETNQKHNQIASLL